MWDDDVCDYQPNRFGQPPRIRIDAFTADQIAMVELLGGDPATAERRFSLFFKEEDGSLVAIKSQERRRGFLFEHACPVVMYRGSWRAISPNGDVHTVMAPSTSE